MSGYVVEIAVVVQHGHIEAECRCCYQGIHL